MNIVQVPITELNPADYNPRRWSKENTDHLMESIKKFGLVDPIIANSAAGRKNIVIGGHFRLHVAKELGYSAVPVFYIDIPEIEKEKELNLRLNRNTGEWDFKLLSDFGEGLLMQVGFTTQEIDKAFKIGKDEDDEFDEDAALAGITEPKAKRGDVYQLGDHRLMCGSSTELKDVSKLMNGEKADMVFTDPPYNVNYSGRGEKTSNTILNDNMGEDDFRKFLHDAFNCMKEASSENAPAYVCYASKTHREFEDALNQNGYQVRNQIIWVKSVASMGWGDYRWKHEPILYVVPRNGTVDFFGDRSQYTEWKEELTDEQLLKKVKKNIEKEEQGESTVWRLKRDSNYEHPTQKPLQLVKTAMRNSSSRGGCVLDLFGGSGSTLIASEQYGRHARLMELDPKYVDVIIGRWEKLTGKKAVLLP